MAKKMFFIFPEAGVMNPYYQMVYCHIKDTHWARITPVQEFSQPNEFVRFITVQIICFNNLKEDYKGLL